MASSVVNVSEIVEVLTNDDYLVEHRTRFVGCLGTPATERKVWEHLHTMGISPGFEHYTKLMDEWVQRTTPSLGQFREILTSCGFKAAVDSLASFGDDDAIIKINQQSSTSVSPRTSNAISFGVLQPASFFTGRDTEVQQLTQLFLNQCPPKIVVISGMGGQGKTELCRQFIKTLKNKNSPPALTWLGGDNSTDLTSSAVQLAQALQIPTTIEGRPIPLMQLLVQVADYISTNYSSSGWLVVIDNVDEIYSEFKQAVDLLVRHDAFVLVTTRRIDVISGEAEPMKLDVMRQEDAQKLVRKCLRQAPTEEEVNNLCHELGNHALALRQAVAYINAQQVENRTSYNIKDYLEDFAKDRSLLNDEVNFVDGYEKTIFLIVTQSIKSISDKHGSLGRRAAQLMEILCLVRPDGISVECLQKFQTITDKGLDVASMLESMNVDLHQTLLLLKKYSLISYDDGSLIYIHRLVQKVAKCHCGSEANGMILKTIELSKSPKEELQQVMHIWEQADTDTVKVFPSLPNRIFGRMINLSLVLEMKPFSENNHQLLTKLLGPDDKNALFMDHNAGIALKENGDYEAALTKFKEVFEKMKRVLGEDHPSTLTTASNMALTLNTMNRFQEALEWNERVLEARLRVLGTNHMDTMTTRHNMALVLKALGRKDEALTLFNKVLHWETENLGHSHPDTLATRRNMALDLGQLEEAEEELESILRLFEEVLGEEHAYTLNTKAWLAVTLCKLERWEEALKMNQEVLTSLEKVLGHNHPNTIITRNNGNAIRQSKFESQKKS